MRKQLTGLAAVIAIVALDQWTKALAVLHLKDQADINLIQGIIELHYLQNYGASFGMLQNRTVLFAVFTTIVLGAMLILFVRLPLTRRYDALRWTMVMLFGGAVGNFIDRLRLGYVVDMIHFYWFEFPVFNVADMFIVVSCALLMILMMFYYQEDELDFMAMIRGSHD